MKIYTNQNAGFKAVNGVIKSISADRKTMEVQSQTWDVETTKFVPSNVKVTSQLPFDETYQPGGDISVVGYPRAGMISADHIFKEEGGYAEERAVINKNGVDKEEGYGFVAGQVAFVRLNEEKNPDGSAKTKADGGEKKRHFDIGVRCENEAGEEMLHIIKVYDGTFTPAGQKTPLEKYRDIFAKHPDEDCRVFITTSALTERDVYSQEKEYNGTTQTTVFANHMGIKSADIVFSKKKEMEHTNQVEQVSTPEQPYEPTVPQEAPTMPEATPDMTRPPLGVDDDYALE